MSSKHFFDVSMLCARQVAVFEGRAAVPVASIAGGFRKVFFLQPGTFDLFGRVQVGPACILPFYNSALSVNDVSFLNKLRGSRPAICSSHRLRC